MHVLSRILFVNSVARVSRGTSSFICLIVVSRARAPSRLIKPGGLALGTS